ncbi:MAG: endonuclease MutS2 [Candidatus Krumholzibacteriia bacterium]
MPAPELAPCFVDPDGHARRVLEFDKLLELAAAEARSPGGQSRLLARVPSTDPERVRAQQELVAEVRSALDAGVNSWPLDGIHDLHPLLHAAKRQGGSLEPLELRRVADTLHAAARMRRFLDKHAESLRRVLELAAGLQRHGELVAAVHKAILETGELADDASAELRRTRERAAREREARLRRLQKRLEESGASSDAYVTLRGDRYVIPVRTTAAGSVRGIVHDRSSSGATLFVEPLEVVDANNELQSLRDAETREIRRILEALTRRVAAESEAASRSVDVLEEIDALHGSAQLSRRMRGASPRLGERLCLRDARHPLLELQLHESGGQVVPLDVEMQDARALVITGPNTGGKTVALKTIGLLALMHQSGLHVPAHPDSELPVFERLVADIGDEQSIEEAESTFSSHLRHVGGALERAGPRLLALMDEFMAGTDPDDGAALAKAVLRRLVARGATTLITTHLGALKLFAHAEPGLANAAMLFDVESRRPLYRLQPGVPGSSNALAIAERLGLEPAILDEARAERGSGAGRLEEALTALEAERRRLQEAREAAEAAGVEACRIREEHAEKLARLDAKRGEHLERARREASDLLSSAQARIEQVVRELRESAASRESIRDAHRGVQELRERLSTPPAPPPRATQGSAGTPPQPGDTVWVRSIGREGELEGVLSDGRARVRFGNAELMVHVRDLERRGRRDSGEPAAAEPRPGSYEVQGDELQSVRLDVRGLDREEALAALDQFLDRALLQGVPLAQIVHGKGTGVLRRSIQERLASHPNVAEFRLGEHGEGGSGVTIVKLR